MYSKIEAGHTYCTLAAVEMVRRTVAARLALYLQAVAVSLLQTLCLLAEYVSYLVRAFNRSNRA